MTPPLENNPKTVQSDTEPVKQGIQRDDDIRVFVWMVVVDFQV